MNAPTVAVFDTNVLVSGFLAASGPPGRIVEWLRTGALRAGVDDRIHGEYDDALHRPGLAPATLGYETESRWDSDH